MCDHAGGHYRCHHARSDLHADVQGQLGTLGCLFARQGWPLEEAVWKSRRSCVPRRRPDVPKSTSSTDVVQILRQTAIEMQGQDCSIWTHNVGRNVCHHSGWAAFLRQKGIIKKAHTKCKKGITIKVFKEANAKHKQGVTTKAFKKGNSRHQQVMRVNLQSGAFTICRRTNLHSIDRLSVVGDLLLKMSPPKTVRQWIQNFNDISEAAPPVEVKNRYMWSWVVRAWMICDMRTANLKRLQWDQDLTVGDLGHAFPDQKGHLLRLAVGTKVADLVNELGYDGPIELLTMYLCLFLGKGMSKYSPEWLQKHRSELITAREVYGHKHQQAPHCNVLCKTVSSTLK